MSGVGGGRRENQYSEPRTSRDQDDHIEIGVFHSKHRDEGSLKRFSF